jgi:hypothetical protein
MKTFIVSAATPLLLALGCAGTLPPPNQQLADVEAASRSANELGAQQIPDAQLHIKLADEQTGKARAAMAEDDNVRAERLLMRAKADAELAIALVRADKAKHQEKNATDQSNAQRSTNMEQGAQ